MHDLDVRVPPPCLRWRPGSRFQRNGPRAGHLRCRFYNKSHTNPRTVSDNSTSRRLHNLAKQHERVPTAAGTSDSTNPMETDRDQKTVQARASKRRGRLLGSGGQPPRPSWRYSGRGQGPSESPSRREATLSIVHAPRCCRGATIQVCSFLGAGPRLAQGVHVGMTPPSPSSVARPPRLHSAHGYTYWFVGRFLSWLNHALVVYESK